MKNASIHFSGCLKKFFVVTTILTIAACSNIGQRETVSEWLPENTPPVFQAAGKLSIRADNQGFQAGFDWENSPQIKHIDILTPLGNTVGRLCQDAIGAVAQNAKGQVFQAATVDELAQQLTGQEIPLNYLDLWAMGRYSAIEPHQILPDGSLIQAGWTISRTLNDNGKPRRLILQRQDLKITVVFQEFNPNHATEKTQCPR
ncbi:MAG: outer membrane lipoprotein LolB [Neisseriaceae bacterium]|nr:outer membrane lipoprotein LolB [Neisseriaceae bacterium]